MDFPLYLTDNEFKYSYDELRQVIFMVLKSQLGEFLQSASLGATFSVHSTDSLLLKKGVETTLTQIKNLTVEDITVSLPNVSVSVKYKDSIVNFQFSINDEN